MAELPGQPGPPPPADQGRRIRGCGRLRVLIAGCGYVGIELGLRLAAAGHRAWGLRRDTSGLPPQIHPIAADLADRALADRLPDVDHVVYAASPDRSTPEAYADAYLTGLANLLEAVASRVGSDARLILVSSTAVYADTGGDWVDEATEPDPDSFRGRIVLEGERLARAGPLAATILRLGGIYGPGRTRLVDRVRSGEATCPADGPVWSNRIHRADAAGAIHHLLTAPDVTDTYVGVDESPSPICDVYRFVAERLGVPPPAVGARGGPSRSNKRCSSRRLIASGFRLTYPSFREGYGAMIQGSAEAG